MAKKYKQRKDGRYETKVTVGRNYETGKPIRIPVYGRTVTELEDNKAIVKADYLRGNDIIHNKITFLDYGTKWLKIIERSLHHKTYEQKHRNIFLHSKIIHYKQLSKIIKSDLQDVINENWEHPRTCQQIKDCMHQLFESAIDDRLINHNPCRNLSMPTYENPDKRALTNNEDYLTDIVEYTDREKTFILLIKWFGLRRGEVLALSTDKIDFDNSNIYINEAVSFDGNNPVLGLPKGKKKRIVPMMNKPKQFLQYYVSNLSSNYLFSNLNNDGLITQSSYRRMWDSIKRKTIAKANDLEINEKLDFTPHTFRHNFATKLREWGIDDKERQYVLGHSSIKVTQDIYTHIDTDKLELRNIKLK